jgi:DNA-binding helix-hairpin-helix protein with protein kinase domain
MEETMQCMKCGEWLPRSKLELMKTGTRRRVCNHCKWLYYVKTSRERAWLRELEERRAQAHQQKHSFRLSKP